MKRNKIILHNILQDLHLFAIIFLIIRAKLFHAQKWKFIFIAEKFFFLSSPSFFGWRKKEQIRSVRVSRGFASSPFHFPLKTH